MRLAVRKPAFRSWHYPSSDFPFPVSWQVRRKAPCGSSASPGPHWISRSLELLGCSAQNHSRALDERPEQTVPVPCEKNGANAPEKMMPPAEKTWMTMYTPETRPLDSAGSTLAASASARSSETKFMAGGIVTDSAGLPADHVSRVEWESTGSGAAPSTCSNPRFQTAASRTFSPRKRDLNPVVASSSTARAAMSSTTP